MAWGDLSKGPAGGSGGHHMLLLLLLLLLGVTSVLGAMLPPRLSTTDTIVRLREGQEGYVLECNKDVGDDPITYRWLKVGTGREGDGTGRDGTGRDGTGRDGAVTCWKMERYYDLRKLMPSAKSIPLTPQDHKIVTGVLGYAYRGFNKVFLALHTIELEHAGTYVCEASNTEGVHSAAIKVIVESRGRQTTVTQELQPHTDEILSEIATSLSDVLAEGECTCDTMFLLHVSTDAEEETVAAQANLVHIIADQIVSETNRVSVVTYSDYLDMKLSFGKGTNKCALRDAFKDLTHQKWTTRLEPVMREAFKKLRKSLSSCKVLFLPIFGSLGAEGADVLGAQHLKKLGVKIFILEVTPEPLEGVQEMASKRGDGYPYHWRVPLFMWRTIVINMNYIAKEVVGCMAEVKDFPKKCVAVDGACTNDTMCQGVGYGCEEGQCVYRECNINPRKPGCCNDASPVNGHWCGDVTSQCTSPNTICDGIVQCMNGADERRCWSTPCPQDKIARCQTSTLCLDLMDLCNGDPECPGGEDEDPRFCKSFPCPRDRPFRCRNGKCIAKESLCDGVFRDCDGGEDEAFEYCKSVHVCPASRSFKCDYGICISEKMVCDGTFNCLDATDELVCDRQNCPAERAFKCLSGLCISMDQVCNGVRDGCDDGSDEQNCTNISCPANRNFKCTDGICIDGRLRCNGRKDCDDNSDEQNCPTPEPPMAPLSPTSPCPHNMFKCNTGACISDSRWCSLCCDVHCAVV
ncbi:Low-density lipoprotein receptor-related protein 2 [Chionoecetes opilio]|uniref:Low-density lipoprotein receptor-related protein 2 n=1 Tax=Chionoecetes opilio TaxID=41210 RepID=A0A8J5D1Z6_CHIOP|nr:Low-density lipoprotein receptor-related protein 2 [Chionoecetes opilio]